MSGEAAALMERLQARVAAELAKKRAHESAAAALFKKP